MTRSARITVLSLNLGGGKAAESDGPLPATHGFTRLLHAYLSEAGGGLVAALQEVASDERLMNVAPTWLKDAAESIVAVSYIPRVSASWYPLVKKWGRRPEALITGPLNEGIAVVAAGEDISLQSWSSAIGSRTGNGAYARVLDLPTIEFAEETKPPRALGWLSVESPIERARITFRPIYFRGTRDSDPRCAQVTRVRTTEGEFILINLHLSTLNSERVGCHQSGVGSRRLSNTDSRFLRYWQLSVVADYVRSEAYSELKLPVVVVGDFNAAPDDQELRWFAEEADLQPVLGLENCWRCGSRFYNTNDRAGLHIAQLGESEFSLEIQSLPTSPLVETVLSQRQVCLNPACHQPRFTHKGNLQLLDNLFVTTPDAAERLQLKSGIVARSARIDLGWEMSDHATVTAELELTPTRRNRL